MILHKIRLRNPESLSYDKFDKMYRKPIGPISDFRSSATNRYFFKTIVDFNRTSFLPNKFEVVLEIPFEVKDMREDTVRKIKLLYDPIIRSNKFELLVDYKVYRGIKYMKCTSSNVAEESKRYARDIKIWSDLYLDSISGSAAASSRSNEAVSRSDDAASKIKILKNAFKAIEKEDSNNLKVSTSYQAHESCRDKLIKLCRSDSPENELTSDLTKKKERYKIYWKKHLKLKYRRIHSKQSRKKIK